MRMPIMRTLGGEPIRGVPVPTIRPTDLDKIVANFRGEDEIPVRIRRDGAADIHVGLIQGLEVCGDVLFADIATPPGVTVNEKMMNVTAEYYPDAGRFRQLVLFPKPRMYLENVNTVELPAGDVVVNENGTAYLKPPGHCADCGGPCMSIDSEVIDDADEPTIIQE